MYSKLAIMTAAVLALAALGEFAHAYPLKVGAVAPDFSAPAGDGTQFKLADYLGRKPVVLFFYPKDGTPGCTKEVCSVRDAFPEIRKFDAVVAGLSYDSVESHQRFAAKHSLPFPLLSDPDGAIAKLYGAYRRIFAKRITFVIGLDKKIAYVDLAVDPEVHGQELVKVLAGLSAEKSR